MKIHIIGGPGSGKSFIGEKLSKYLKINHYDLDNIFWDNNAETYNKRNSTEKRNNEFEKIIKQESWIIEGVYYSWLNESFNNADYIFILKPNVYLRDWRIIKRFVLRKLEFIKSKKKETISSLIELLRWNHQYDNNNLINAMHMLKEYPHKVFEVQNNEDIYRFL